MVESFKPGVWLILGDLFGYYKIDIYTQTLIFSEKGTQKFNLKHPISGDWGPRN